jgi:hypothetical protein
MPSPEEQVAGLLLVLTVMIGVLGAVWFGRLV